MVCFAIELRKEWSMVLHYDKRAFKTVRPTQLQKKLEMDCNLSKYDPQCTKHGKCREGIALRGMCAHIF